MRWEERDRRDAAKMNHSAQLEAAANNTN